jgi:hypothetical protein
MNVSRKSILGVALAAVIVLGAIAPSLRAWPFADGRFKLAFDAQLGETIALPTGDYTFSVDRSGGSYGTISVYRGGEAVATVLPQTVDSKVQNEKPELVCIRHDGKVTVRALSLPNVGTFYFAVPKDLKMLAAKQPELVEMVPVEVRGE